MSSEITKETSEQENWKRQTYITGTLTGAAFGLVASYLFARAAEEDAERNGGKPSQIKTGQLISLALAAMALMRQISEMGKSDDKKSSKK